MLPHNYEAASFNQEVGMAVTEADTHHNPTCCRITCACRNAAWQRVCSRIIYKVSLLFAFFSLYHSSWDVELAIRANNCAVMSHAHMIPLPRMCV